MALETYSDNKRSNRRVVGDKHSDGVLGVDLKKNYGLQAAALVETEDPVLTFTTSSKTTG